MTVTASPYEIGQVVELESNIKFRVASVAKTETSGEDWEVRGEATVCIPGAETADVHESRLEPGNGVTHYSIVVNGGLKILSVQRVWPKVSETTGEKSFLVIDDVIVTD